MYYSEFISIIENTSTSFDKLKELFCRENNSLKAMDYSGPKQILPILESFANNINIEQVFSFYKRQNDSNEIDIDVLISKIDSRLIDLEVQDEHQKSDKDFSLEYCQWERIKPQSKNSLHYYIEYFKGIIVNLFKDNSLKKESLWALLLNNDFINDNNTIDIDNVRIVINILVSDERLFLHSKTQELIKRIEKAIRKYNTDNDIDVESIYLLFWYSQLLSFVLKIDSKVVYAHLDISNQTKEGVFYLAYLFAENCWNSNDYQNGIIFAQFSIKSSIINIKADSYNVLGLCAIDNGNKQLAYDVYYSWINCKTVNDLRYDESLTKIDLRWRKTPEGKTNVAIMKNNFAYVCTKIYRAIEKNDHRWSFFYNTAKEQILQAQESAPQEESYYCTAGAILFDGEDYEESLFQYKKYKTLCKNKDELISAVRQCLEVKLSLLYSNIVKDGFNYNKNAKQCFKSFLEDLDEYYHSVNTDDKDISDDEYELWKSYSNLFDLHNYCKKKTLGPKIEFLLFSTFILCDHIKSSLSHNEYGYSPYLTRNQEIDKYISENIKGPKPIAYYTSLSTAQYLFDPIQNEYDSSFSSEQKNCFTIMNAKYMNDPNEGLPLLNTLFSSDRFYSFNFRQELYRNNFIFLKSFTENIDSLIMWNRYGRNSGGDSDGCCLLIDPITFDRIVNSNESDKNLIKQFDKNNDDFNLFRIVYITKDGIIDKDKNTGLSNSVIDDYELLKSIIQDLLLELDKKPNNEAIEFINLFLQYCFRFIIFLFKDDDYSHEKESRIIIRRSLDNLKSVKMVSNNPPKLCIKPFFQVYIKEVIFGPNCSDVEKWEPYFQYGLAKMWQEECQSSNGLTLTKNLPYNIKQSDINYKP